MDDDMEVKLGPGIWTEAKADLTPISSKRHFVRAPRRSEAKKRYARPKIRFLGPFSRIL
jgi:hypothetical protein